MFGLLKIKRSKVTASADDSLLPLDSPGSVVVFIPGDQEYDEMMEKY